MHHPGSRQITRRALWRGALAAGAGFVLDGVALGGCGRGDQGPAAPCTIADRSPAEHTLTVAGRPGLLDVQRGGTRTRHPSLDAFMAETGIQVAYAEDLPGDAAYLSEVQRSIEACEPAGQDLAMLAGPVAARVVGNGWARKLDPATVPNVREQLLQSLRGRSWDPNGEYAVPWRCGLTGIAYDATRTRPVRSLDELFGRLDLKGRATVLPDLGDTMGAVLFAQGHDPSRFTPPQFDDALDRLAKAIADGHLRRVRGETHPLAHPGVVAGLVRSTDLPRLVARRPGLRFVAPDAGVLLWSDDAIVPGTAAHPGNAEQLLDHYFEPKVAAALAGYLRGVCPVQGAQAEAEKISLTLARDRLVFPDAPTLGRAKVFMGLDAEQETSCEARFRQVLG